MNFKLAMKCIITAIRILFWKIKIFEFSHLLPFFISSKQQSNFGCNTNDTLDIERLELHIFLNTIWIYVVRNNSDSFESNFFKFNFKKSYKKIKYKKWHFSSVHQWNNSKTGQIKKNYKNERKKNMELSQLKRNILSHYL